MALGLWEAGLSDWYGPATPLVRRVRRYRPNRRGEIKLARWLRVGVLRALACGAVGAAVYVVLDSSALDLTDGERPLAAAVLLACGSVAWRFSLIRVVLRPGEIVRVGVWRQVTVECTAVRRLHRESWRQALTLRTHGGEDVDFYLLDNSLWDALYNFSAVFEDATRTHTRTPGAPTNRTPLTWQYTRSLPAEALAAGAVACAVWGAGVSLFG
ncbi:hypothetical protein ACFVT5_28210 [Streptomyces sp. NPDC058001]|uniref:hypothetical protein n=1 Tax=Streptomyces sp. NPDC058001 TaxID=3346300 RepID=UPI0036E533E1